MSRKAYLHPLLGSKAADRHHLTDPELFMLNDDTGSQSFDGCFRGGGKAEGQRETASPLGC